MAQWRCRSGASCSHRRPSATDTEKSRAWCVTCSWVIWLDRVLWIQITATTSDCIMYRKREMYILPYLAWPFSSMNTPPIPAIFKNDLNKRISNVRYILWTVVKRRNLKEEKNLTDWFITITLSNGVSHAGNKVVLPSTFLAADS